MKYPRTYHLPFSEEVHSDDKVLEKQYLDNFLNTEIIITEKLDGGNCCLKPNIGVFARSHSQNTDHPSFDYIKNIHYYSKLNLLNPDYLYYGENMFARHSISYDNLTDYFYLFNIVDNKKEIFLSFKNMVEEADRCNFKTVPVLFKGKMKSLKELEKFCKEKLKEKSSFGNEIEGFVIRVAREFKINEFSKNVAKFVRKNHVQTDEHWNKNWIKNKLKTSH